MSEIKKKLDVIIREELRKGNITQTSDILSGVSDILDAIEVDVAAIQEKITNNRNPLNAVFRLFGLQLVRNDYVEVTGTGNKVLKKLVTFDDAMMKDVVAIFAKKLEKIETEGKTRESELTGSVNGLNVEADSLRKELSLARSNMRAQKESLAVSLQDCVARLDKSTQIELVENMEDLIEELGYKVNWKPSGMDDKQFHFQTVTQLKRENELQPAEGVQNVYVSKPSLRSEDGEIIKGFAYILNNTEG